MASRSSSSNSQKSSTQQFDNRIGVEGAEFAQILGGSNNNFEVLDAGAIEGARDITALAIELVDGALDAISAGGDRLIGLSEASQAASLAALQQARDTEETGLANAALKQAIPLALIGGVVLIFWLRKRG